MRCTAVRLVLLAFLLAFAVAALRLLSNYFPRPEHDANILSPASPDFQGFLARSEARTQVCRDVVDGKLTLIEAADAFLKIQGEHSPRILSFVEGNSVEEKLCRQVISGVFSLECDLKLDSRVSRRLQAELECRLEAESFGWSAGNIGQP